MRRFRWIAMAKCTSNVEYEPAQLLELEKPQRAHHLEHEVKSNPATGSLQVVATPIGNLQDFSPRARAALEGADAIVAEDTRHTGLLLQKLGLPKKPLLSFFGTREAQRIPHILKRIREGERLVLLTDAGTPGISDPGARLLRAIHQEGLRIEPIPGPSALTTALSVSSLCAGPFAFEGFLPSNPSRRRRRLDELKEEQRPLVFFEAPHRIRETLEDFIEILGGDRAITMVREGTKLHEEIVEITITELLSRLPEKPKGEITLVVEGAAASPTECLEVDPVELVRMIAGFGISLESAARKVAQHFSIPRSRLLRASEAGKDRDRTKSSSASETFDSDTVSSDDPNPSG
jgi:16S rRNA (cytidine1402-2'-O)-methyltransferase